MIAQHLLRFMAGAAGSGSAPHVVLDDFTRANNNTLGASWYEPDPGYIGIDTNQARFINAANNRQARWDTDFGSPDLWVELDHVADTSTASGAHMGVIARVPASWAETYYYGRYYYNQGRWEIYRRNAGTFSLLNSATETVSIGYRIRLEVEANGSDVDLRLYQVTGGPGGTKTLKVSYTDTSGSKITTGNYIGIRGATQTTIFDNFDGGTL